jgi:hypothetical protein
MKEEIKNNLENPQQLEKLYRENKTTFRKAFDLVYPEIKNSLPAQIWNERLNFEQREISWGAKNELLAVIVISIIAGIIAKIPDLTGIDAEFFYPRNLSFIVFPMLATYFAWKQSLQIRQLLIVSALFVASIAYINLLPNDSKSDTLILACIHLPLFLWTVLGYTFTGDKFKNNPKRIDFLRYNGDLIVMTTVILIAGGILSAVTIGLFDLIKIRIEEFYFQNIAVWGLAAAPIVGTYLVRSNPQLVKNVSPVVAKVFTPLVLVMLVVYLIAIVYTGKDPYNDREFLLIFNLLLIGVMAIILFSTAETSKATGNKASILLLFVLSIVTIVINGIALSAIVFRISEWGITPNRLAVLGSNILILINLTIVSYRLFKSIKSSDELATVENSIATFLPIYSAWTVVVIFIFPILFSFR